MQNRDSGSQWLYQPSLRLKIAVGLFFAILVIVIVSMNIYLIVIDQGNLQGFEIIMFNVLFMLFLIRLPLMYYSMDRFLLSHDTIYFPISFRPPPVSQNKSLRYEEIKRIYFAEKVRGKPRMYVIEDKSGRQFLIPEAKSKEILPVIETVMQGKGLAYGGGDYYREAPTAHPSSQRELEFAVKMNRLLAVFFFLFPMFIFSFMFIAIPSFSEWNSVITLFIAMNFIMFIPMGFFMLWRSKKLLETPREGESAVSGINVVIPEEEEPYFIPDRVMPQGYQQYFQVPYQQAFPGYSCRYCRQPLTYVYQYQRWYCNYCRQYV